MTLCRGVIPNAWIVNLLLSPKGENNELVKQNFKKQKDKQRLACPKSLKQAEAAHLG